MFNPDYLVRPNVKALVPYSCARDEFQGKEGVFLDANENPYGYLNRYPDPYQRDLKIAISKLRKIPAERIFLGNGSDEIIDLTFRIFCNPGIDKALTFSPSYGMYQVSASVNDVQIIKIPLNKDFQIDFEDVSSHLSDKNLKLILICSPNNPTGNSMNRQTVERIISQFQGVVLVDEAYMDFSDKPSLLEKIADYPNLIVMQTFSKAFGLASVRVGVAYTSPEIVAYYNKMKPPYNISTINQKAVLQKLTKFSAYTGQIRKIKKERERLSRELENIPVIQKVYPSDANFVLVKVEDSGKLYNYLVDNGIVVRNRHSVIDNCIRITVGTRAENSKLLYALNNFGK
ncbi:MAG TPA: histidinol-phosphate transaminase [Bacteroidales bacterium]|nr:histidinol-phosphate transaminase [Bacteroidales bacterium]